MCIRQDRLGYTAATNNLHISVVPKDSVLLTPHVCLELAAAMLHILHPGTQAEMMIVSTLNLARHVAEAGTDFSSWKSHISRHTFCQPEQVPWVYLSSRG